MPSIELSSTLQLTDPVQAVIDHHHTVGDFRPVVVGAVCKPDGTVLMVESAKKAGEWGLLQGGIDYGETPFSALPREADEEVRLDPTKLRIGEVTEVMPIAIPNGHSSRRGFEKGKLYVVLPALYTGKDRLQPDPAEVRQALWVNPLDAEALLLNKRAEKRDLLLRAISHTSLQRI